MADSDGHLSKGQGPPRRRKPARVSVGVLLLLVLVVGGFGIRELVRDPPPRPAPGGMAGPSGITKPDRQELLRQVRALRDDLVAGRITIDWAAGKAPGSPADALSALESLAAALLSPDMIVFVKDGADGGALTRLAASWSEVESASLVSKEEALARLKEDLKDRPEMLPGSLVSNPLPVSVEILLHDASTASTVEARLRADPGVGEVRYRRDDMQATLKTIRMLQSLARPADPNDTVASPTTALTKVPPLSAAVPAGLLLEETERTTASLSTLDSSLRVHAGSFDEYQKSHDFLAGPPVTRVNGLSVDGQPADVYRVEFPNQGGEITAEYALIWVDKATGLRFREKG